MGIIFCILLFTGGQLQFGKVINVKTSGEAGAFIGGTAGALWALAGVLFFRAALRVQREELTAQRKSIEVQKEELSLQRKELSLQREEMTLTRGVFKQQTFETTFFNLLSLKDEIAERALRAPHSKKFTAWRPSDIAEKAINFCLKNKKIESSSNIHDYLQIRLNMKEELIPYVDKFSQIISDEKNNIFGPCLSYIKIIFSIIELIESSSENWTTYSKIFSSTLKYDEQFAILYYSMADSIFLEKIYKHNIVEGIHSSILFHPNHINFFSGYIIKDDILVKNAP